MVKVVRKKINDDKYFNTKGVYYPMLIILAISEMRCDF
jgi:hypothetical protein